MRALQWRKPEAEKIKIGAKREYRACRELASWVLSLFLTGSARVEKCQILASIFV